MGRCEEKKDQCISHMATVTAAKSTHSFCVAEEKVSIVDVREGTPRGIWKSLQQGKKIAD